MLIYCIKTFNISRFSSRVILSIIQTSKLIVQIGKYPNNQYHEYECKHRQHFHAKGCSETLCSELNPEP